MSRVLIVGIGNPLRSDDGLGWHAAQDLLREALNDVQVVAAQQLTPEISELASKAARVVFIDAAREGKPGSLRCELITLPASPSSRHSHDLSPAGVLKMAQDLYGRCAQGYLLTVAGDCFDTGDTLSAAAAAALPALKERIRLLVRLAADEPQG